MPERNSRRNEEEIVASNYTLAVTSCNRHDLLRQTLQSFIDTADLMPQETIIIEDGDTPEPIWLKESPFRQFNARWLSNTRRSGQIYSIDRLYSEIKTDYIFHCEDDWQFCEQGFVQPSKEILQKHPEVIMVSLRGDTGWHPLVSDSRFPFKIAEPNWRGGWGGIAFNPGMRRMSDYKRIGSSYGRHVAYGSHGLGHEMELSKMHLSLGYVIADLGYPYLTHIGGGRSRAIEPLPPPPRVLIAIPACHKFVYSQWESEQSPHYDAATAWNGVPYGSDIHISGENPRIDAVRETWFKDIKPFDAHVTGKFFYGEPHPRPALPDEVYIPCGDDYASLPRKTLEICKYALRGGYDYLFKADDDTAVYVDRLVKELLETRFDYAGFTNANICTGGPGYWLSRAAMQAVVDKFDSSHWAEDVTVGKIMALVNINPVMLPNHHSGFAAHWYFPNGFDPTRNLQGVVAFHAVQPEIMREWYQHERSL
jgi:hypothetical protein